MQISRILVAVDDSDFSSKTATAAHELAKTLKAGLAIVNVMDPAILAISADSVVYPMEQMVDLKKGAEMLIQKIRQQLGDDIPLADFIGEGKPSEEIVAIANQWNADLIVIGTHGRTGVMHLIMGSVAESVIRHSNIPVLVMPSKHL
ncbi:MAG: universal stress protein [Bacteroidia bacterium]